MKSFSLSSKGPVPFSGHTIDQRYGEEEREDEKKGGGGGVEFHKSKLMVKCIYSSVLTGRGSLAPNSCSCRAFVSILKTQTHGNAFVSKFAVGTIALIACNLHQISNRP